MLNCEIVFFGRVDLASAQVVTGKITIGRAQLKPGMMDSSICAAVGLLATNLAIGEPDGSHGCMIAMLETVHLLLNQLVKQRGSCIYDCLVFPHVELWICGTTTRQV